MVKCKSLRINMLRITHTGKSVNFPVTVPLSISNLINLADLREELSIISPVEVVHQQFHSTLDN